MYPISPISPRRFDVALVRLSPSFSTHRTNQSADYLPLLPTVPTSTTTTVAILFRVTFQEEFRGASFQASSSRPLTPSPPLPPPSSWLMVCGAKGGFRTIPLGNFYSLGGIGRINPFHSFLSLDFF